MIFFIENFCLFENLFDLKKTVLQKVTKTHLKASYCVQDQNGVNIIVLTLVLLNLDRVLDTV